MLFTNVRGSVEVKVVMARDSQWNAPANQAYAAISSYQCKKTSDEPTE
jgi:hypothetical protein